MQSQQTLLLESEYFPCLAWYQQYLQHPTVLIEQHEFFERASLRNRCYISSANGKLVLSVPLEGGRNQHTCMNDIRISYRDAWQVNHQRTLQACYGRSPFYEYYAETIFSIFDKKYTFLLDLNMASLQIIDRLLSIKKEIIRTTSYEINYPATYLDWRKHLRANNYQPLHEVRYAQPFEGQHEFIPGLSMLDMLFCTAKQATVLLLA